MHTRTRCFQSFFHLSLREYGQTWAYKLDFRKSKTTVLVAYHKQKGIETQHLPGFVQDLVLLKHLVK